MFFIFCFTLLVRGHSWTQFDFVVAVVDVVALVILGGVVVVVVVVVVCWV